MDRREITHDDWLAEAERRFGKDPLDWRFVCPCCGHIAAIRDWKAIGASEGEAAFSCVGRRSLSPRDAFGEGPGPCNYTGGGLFGLNPVQVKLASGNVRATFEFAS